MIPFDVTIPKERQDHTLSDKLAMETSGILNWLLHGTMEWLDRGLDEPQVILDATADYRSSSNIVSLFLEECCHRHPEATVGATPLYEMYRTWAEKRGQRPSTQTAFGEALASLGFHSKRYTSGPDKGRTNYGGLCLLDQ